MMAADDRGYVGTLSRWTALAFDDTPAALSDLRGMCEAAIAAGRPERAAVLAAQAVQWQISDFASLAGLREWSTWLVATRPDPAALEVHAALIYCAGVIAAHQFLDAFDAPVREQLLPIETCLAHYRERVLVAREGALDANILVATAEHPASWWSNTGDRASVDQLSVVVDRTLGDPWLAPHVRARWLFWLGCIMMQNDQRAPAEATWARARVAAGDDKTWRWLEFHLNRVALRPLLEDQRLDEAAPRLEALKASIDPSRPLDLGDYHHLRGWHALLADEPRLAMQHYRLALGAARAAGLPRHMAAVYDGGLAQSLVAMGEELEALPILAAMPMVPGPRGEAQLACTLGIARALHARRTGAPQYAQHLAGALAAARDLGILRFLRALPRHAAVVCADALEFDIESEFVRKVIATRALTAPSNAGEAWPWPVKLYGLRPFGIVIDGEPLRFDGKAPAKPLQLLRLLIAQGGEPTAIGGVMDRLWPDLEADDARRAFDVTLNRLRALLVQRDVLLLADGKLGFDAHRVWIDTHALAQVLREAGTNAADAAARKRSFERIARLYRQPLLAGDDDPWIVGAREQWRRRFMLAVDALAREAERAGDAAETAWMRQWAASLAAD